MHADFFCRPEDPSYLQALKVNALGALADATNAYDVAEELTRYVAAAGGLGGDADLARAAVAAVARIALRVRCVPRCAALCCAVLGVPRLDVRWRCVLCCGMLRCAEVEGRLAAGRACGASAAHAPPPPTLAAPLPSPSRPQLPGVPGLLDRLLLFLTWESRPAAAAEALRRLADVLRAAPEAADVCVDTVASLPPEVREARWPVAWAPAWRPRCACCA
jgi:hypothetical protein